MPFRKNDFKIGDRVVLARNTYNKINHIIGATAIVYGVDNGWTQFEWVRNGLDKNQCNGGYYEEDFDLIINIFSVYKNLLRKRI